MTDSIGWVCPKCSKVYAPHVMECHTCNDMASKQPQAIPNQPLPQHPWIPPPPWIVTCDSIGQTQYGCAYMQVVQ